MIYIILERPTFRFQRPWMSLTDSHLRLLWERSSKNERDVSKKMWHFYIAFLNNKQDIYEKKAFIETNF